MLSGATQRRAVAWTPERRNKILINNNLSSIILECLSTPLCEDDYNNIFFIFVNKNYYIFLFYQLKKSIHYIYLNMIFFIKQQHYNNNTRSCLYHYAEAREAVVAQGHKRVIIIATCSGFDSHTRT